MSFSYNIQLECDSENCQTFSDIIGMDEEEANQEGKRLGWEIKNDRHYCPKCKERRADLARRSDEFFKNIFE